MRLRNRENRVGPVAWPVADFFVIILISNLTRVARLRSVLRHAGQHGTTSVLHAVRYSTVDTRPTASDRSVNVRPLLVALLQATEKR